MNTQPQTIEEQFVPYEIALKLKELGFTEVCLACYKDTEGTQKIFPYVTKEPSNSLCSAPLWQQVFDWFRERYNHSGEVYFYSSADLGKWHFDIEPLKLDGERFTTPVKEGFQTYSLARESCIEKLIEIIENSKKP